MSPSVSRQDLAPLVLAVRVIHERVHGTASANQHKLERLNGVAYAMSAIAPMYTGDGHDSNVRLISADELLNGVFRDGGKQLQFLDGRPPLTLIGVTREAIDKTADALLLKAAAAGALRGNAERTAERN